MLHKTDKGLIYGVRGVIHFFKKSTGFFPKEKRTHEKTYVFSHALLHVSLPPKNVCIFKCKCILSKHFSKAGR